MGLPGSGKSFLLKDLNINNCAILSEERFYNECKTISSFSKIKKSLFIFLKFFDLIFLLFIYLFIKDNKKYNFRKIVEFIKYLILYDIIIKKNKNIDIIVLDQGLIQFLWSFVFLDKKELSSKILGYSMKKCIKTFGIEIIYYSVAPDLAAGRSQKREKKCELDYLEYNEELELYKIHSNDILFIKKISGIKIVYNKKELIDIIIEEENEKK